MGKICSSLGVSLRSIVEQYELINRRTFGSFVSCSCNRTIYDLGIGILEIGSIQKFITGPIDLATSNNFAILFILASSSNTKSRSRRGTMCRNWKELHH